MSLVILLALTKAKKLVTLIPKELDSRNNINYKLVELKQSYDK
jgi:hypothetical protein